MPEPTLDEKDVQETVKALTEDLTNNSLVNPRRNVKDFVDEIWDGMSEDLKGQPPKVLDYREKTFEEAVRRLNLGRFYGCTLEQYQSQNGESLPD